jgi:hypothetical protein
MSKWHLFLQQDYFILGDISGIRLVLYENQLYPRLVWARKRSHNRRKHLLTLAILIAPVTLARRFAAFPSAACWLSAAQTACWGKHDASSFYQKFLVLPSRSLSTLNQAPSVTSMFVTKKTYFTLFVTLVFPPPQVLRYTRCFKSRHSYA